MKIGQKVKTVVFGKLQTVLILAVYPLGTVDVQLENGNCYRISGLSLGV